MTQFFIRVHQSGMSFEEVLSLARAADRHGYDGISLYDRLRAPGLECWTTLTAIATLTSRLRVIPLVLAATYRHPAVMAKMAATLDRITEGRLILGLGAGGDREDHAAYGLPWAPTAARVARLQEAVAILRFLWSGAQGPFAGAHYGTIIGPGQPTPHRPGGPPVLIGGHGEQHLLRAVAENGDVANIGFDLSLEEWEAKRRLLTRYMVQVGRSPEALRLSHNATVILTEGCEGVRSHTSEVARRYGISEIRARVATASGVVGGPRECADRLREYERFGVTSFFLLFPDLPDTRMMKSFARKVLPTVR